MPAEPRIEVRPEQPYVGIRGFVTMQTVGAIADRLPEVFGWLAARGIEPAGSPFFRFNVIDMERQLDIEAGVRSSRSGWPTSNSRRPSPRKERNRTS